MTTGDDVDDDHDDDGREVHDIDQVGEYSFTYFIRRSPGLVVMGGDSCSKGWGFESQRCILDGHFSHLFVVKIVMFV